jgi:hypothetical protein
MSTGGLPVQTGALNKVDLDLEALDSHRGIWFLRLQIGSGGLADSNRKSSTHGS